MIQESTSELLSLRDEVALVLVEVLNIDVPSHNMDLLAAGLLDSLGFVDLLVELERRFGVHVAVESLEPDDFRSVARIAAFIVAQRQAA